MKQHQLKALLVGVVALALGACSTTGRDMSSQTSSTTTTTTTSDTAAVPAVPGQQADSSASSPSSPSSSSMTSTTQSPSSTASTSMPDQAGYTSSPAMANANSIVTLIEAVPRQSANLPGSDTSGTSGSSGTTGSTAAGANDKVYRVTLHMDDGSTRVITQEIMPTFRAGDRVRLENGMITR